VLVSRCGLPPLVGFLGAGIIPALASLVVGAPSLRLKGLYLAITTLAFSFLINTVILEARTVTNGARGIAVQRPEIFGVSFDSDAAFTQLCLGFAILTLFATLNIRRSRVGRAFVAIRDNDTAARVMGINLHAYKLFAFVTSAFITGLAGALYGIYLSFVSVEGFPFLLSIEALAILIVGGLGSALGAVLGTILIVLLPEATRLMFGLFSAQMDALFSTGAQELKSILYGLVIILFLRFQPRGLVGAWHDIRRLWVNWPLRY
jgi:branched-chain amino acid transport system permease protein